MEKFRELLASNLEFPASYTFKFVAPLDSVEAVRSLLAGCELSERKSRTGRYISVTGVRTVHSVDEVVLVYEKASKIEGIVSL